MTNMEIAQEALDKGCEEVGVQKGVKIVTIKNDRWILSYVQDPASPDFGNYMIKLERWIKHHLGIDYLELMLETTADRNKRDVRTGREIKMVSARNVESLE